MSETWATTGLVSDSQAMRSPQARGSSMLNLGRRGFIALIGDLATWPLVARAQEARKLPTIGVLGGANASAWRPWTAAFVERLRELGWIEGRTIAIEYRWAEGRDDRKAEIAAEFVRLKADVIVTDGGSTLAAKNVTSVIPIVFALASDPLGRGLVTSLARPGGNVTGLSLLAPDLAGKRLEVMREILPGLRRLAIMFDVGYPSAVLEVGEVHATAGALGLEVAPLEIQRAEDIAPRRSRPKRTHFTSWIMHSLTPTARASSRLRSARGCRRSVVSAITSKPGVSCPTDQTSRLCFGAPPT